MPDRICIYFRIPPRRDKWIKGDRYIISLLKFIFKKRKISGVERVFINLCKSFGCIHVNYIVNPPFRKLRPTDRIIVLGLGKYCLDGYDKPNKIVAGIALMTHPSEWPGLFKDYPVARYLQHSDWARKVYVPYYGEEQCITWPAGIDTAQWAPKPDSIKKHILIYNKLRWDNDRSQVIMKESIIRHLEDAGYTCVEIIYGQYYEKEYQQLLAESHAMIFLSSHESQGFASCEALSMNVPVYAWDPGLCLDPNRFVWNDPVIPATSVPFFDERCGLTFDTLETFILRLPEFLDHVAADKYEPRQYVLENISLEKSGTRMMDILEEVYG